MKVFDAENIRNVGVVGHGGCGKTTLCSALAFDMGAVNRLGRVEDGTAITDFDPDEVERKISLQLGLAHGEFEWSHDVFDPTIPHDAYWTFNEGFGIADSVQTVVYDAVGQRITEVRDSVRIVDRDRLLREGQARLQVLLDRYIGFNQ